MSKEDLFKFDKSAFSIRSVEDQDKNRAYWMAKTPAERLYAAFRLTRRAYGLDPDTDIRMDKTHFKIRKR